MPYAKTTDLPAREPIAHRIAWAAVKRRYARVPGGVWVPRSKRA